MGLSFNKPLYLILLLPLIISIFLPASKGNKGIKGMITAINRVVIYVLLVMAITSPEIYHINRNQAVIFVADLSDSTKELVKEQEDFIKKAISTKGSKDIVGVVTFGLNPTTEILPAEKPDFNRFHTVVQGGFTDIEKALKWTIGLFPSGYQKRVVLLTDGQENSGNGAKGAEFLKHSGIRVDVYPLNSYIENEVLIKEISVPNRLHVGERYRVITEIQSTMATTVTFNLTINGSLVKSEDLRLVKGNNRYSLYLTAQQEGNLTFMGEILPTEDTMYQNNRAWALSSVHGAPHILIIEGRQGEGENISRILSSQNIPHKNITPHQMLPTMEYLYPFQSVVMVNVPAYLLGERKMELLEKYVKELGRGLLVFGGENSFAPGGYKNTPLERILPVDMDLKNRGQIPRISLLLVIDKSGSMGGMEGGYKKMELAKEAAILATNILTPEDRVGVLAFDSGSIWVVPTGYADDLDGIHKKISSITEGGGTEIYPALEEAYKEALKEDTPLKHIILLTDGISATGGDYKILTRNMVDNGITLTTVGVGSDTDRILLENLANWGEGRFYYTDRFADLPNILTKESMIATRTFFVNEEFHPKLVNRWEPITEHFVEGIPKLGGYVATTPKNASRVILSSHREEPILSLWDIGLGRALAWTFDINGLWSSDWLRWNKFGRIITDMITWSLPDSSDLHYHISTDINGPTGSITLVFSSDIDPLPFEGKLIYPTGNVEDINFYPIKPGQFKGSFPAVETGTYFLEIRGDGKNISSGFIIPYSREYLAWGRNDRVLNSIVNTVGGGFIKDPKDAFDNNLFYIPQKTPIFRWLILAAIVLFTLDIGIRKFLYIPEKINKKTVEKTKKIKDVNTVEKSPPIANTSSISRLLKAKKKFGR